jgi:hypothetical protein
VKKGRILVPPKTDKKPYSKPKITDLGDWLTAEEKIRERALALGMQPGEIEILLEELKEARKNNLKSSDDS